MQKYRIPGSSKNIRLQRYQKYRKVGSLKARLERPQLPIKSNYTYNIFKILLKDT
jgi:hypothetical protein